MNCFLLIAVVYITVFNSARVPLTLKPTQRSSFSILFTPKPKLAEETAMDAFKKRARRYSISGACSAASFRSSLTDVGFLSL